MRPKFGDKKLIEELKREAIEHVDTKELICPYCGHKHEASRFFKGIKMDAVRADSNLVVRCEQCDLSFYYKSIINVTYSTWAKHDVDN